MGKISNILMMQLKYHGWIRHPNNWNEMKTYFYPKILLNSHFQCKSHVEHVLGVCKFVSLVLHNTQIRIVSSTNALPLFGKNIFHSFIGKWGCKQLFSWLSQIDSRIEFLNLTKIYLNPWQETQSQESETYQSRHDSRKGTHNVLFWLT